MAQTNIPFTPSFLKADSSRRRNTPIQKEEKNKLDFAWLFNKKPQDQTLQG